MLLIDIHTHNCVAEHAIYNCSNGYVADKRISIGIHPWHINEKWEREFNTIAEIAKADNVVAIGECGLDKLKSPVGIELQKEIFRAQALLAEKVEKPLMIHCVKAYNELIPIHKAISPKQAWIIHGFRGKPAQAEQLIRAGFYISLGEQFNPDSAKAIPAERLFIESDESNVAITGIYAAVAQARGTTVEELALQTIKNAARCGIIL